MDLIYQNAELTIIAGFGLDPTCGLPGVGLCKRPNSSLTTCAKIGKHSLISVDVGSHIEVWGISCSKRAWTYQEALLSRRRLIFTKEEMSFECCGMYTSESVHLPLTTLHRKDRHGFKKDFLGINKFTHFRAVLDRKLLTFCDASTSTHHATLLIPQTY
jgi:hypothetical protein